MEIEGTQDTTIIWKRNWTDMTLHSQTYISTGFKAEVPDKEEHS